MPRLSHTSLFLQSPSFRQAQSALIGQLTQCIVIGWTPQAHIGNVTSLSIIPSFSFQSKYKRQLIMSLVLPSVQARKGNRVTGHTQWWSSYVFAHKPRLRKLTPLWCDPVSLSHTARKTLHLNSQYQILKLITKHTHSCWFRSARLS